MVATYVPKGPFTNGSATPPIDKAFLDGIETTLVELTTPTGGGAGSPNAITGWYHTDAYGAVGDGTTIDRAAIQAAISAAGNAYVATGAFQRVYLPPKVHLVDAVTYYNDDSSPYGVVSLMLYDGVELFGPGTIKVKAGAYGSGALYSVIRSKSSGITSAKIRDITIDGNKANQVPSLQCSNVSLNAATDVEISHTRQLRANGNGILITGTTSQPATNIRIKDNDVASAAFIGIQASQFNGIDIDNNVVAGSGNNGIDIYGENGTTTSSGTNFRISNNRCRDNGGAGIFPETVAYGIVENNHLNNNGESGIHVNRINGAPTGVVLQGNQCTGSPIGIYITGDMSPGSVYIRGNTITNVATAGIQMGGGGAALSYVYIDGNFIDMAVINTGALILIASGTTTWSQSTIRRTITKNTDRARDVVNNATTTAASVSFDAANV